MHDHDDDESSISESYVAKQRERDGRYQREYAEWINSMPPEERRKFKEPWCNPWPNSHSRGLYRRQPPRRSPMQ